MKTRFLIAVALLACACSSQERNDFRTYNVTGPVKEIILQSDTIAMPWTASFNRSGRLTKLVITNLDGSEYSVRTYRYNCRKQLTAMNGVVLFGEKKMDYKYKYDGDFTKECRTYDSEHNEVYRWVYENDGRNIVRTAFYESDTLQFYGVRDYTGEHYSSRVYNPEGELISTTEVDFNGYEDRPTCIVSDDENIIIAYDEKGLPVRSFGTVVNSTGELQHRSDLAEYPWRYYTYEFDEHGNWITRYERKEPGSPEAIVLKRTIIYY